jgi:argininosuccinate lyase
MMPNKLNPDAMELLRGECNAVAAAHGEAVSILKGLPSGYNRDLQCLKPVLQRAAEKLRACTSMAGAFLAALDFDAEKLAAAAGLGHIGATLRMEEHVREGIPLRAAHHTVAEEVAAGDDPASPRISDPLGRYRTVGSTHPDEVRRVAQGLRDALREEACRRAAEHK